MSTVFDVLEEISLARTFVLSDEASGLRAVIAIDDVTLGPAAGGVRTRAYASFEDAVRDAAALARAMTVKCAIAGLDAGGGKCVVIDHPGLDRTRAFEVLGARIEELSGLFRTAGDLGTTKADLDAMARATRYVHANEGDLAAAVARGLVACVRACAERRGHGRELALLRVAVQGAGAIGRACVRALVAAGAHVLVADLDEGRARAVADEAGADVISADEVLLADVDVVCPCAIGGVVTEDVAARARAWAIVPAANNALASHRAGALLHERGTLFVPDVIASAGAVIDGIGSTVMNLPDRTPLIDALGDTTSAVLARAASESLPTTEIAERLARERIRSRGTPLESSSIGEITEEEVPIT